MKIEKPIFQWKNFGRSIVILLTDFLIMIMLIGGIAGLFYFMFVYCEIQSPRLFSGRDYVDIIRSIVWPISSLIVLLLFRNPIMRIVYELPGFVRRSHYGQEMFSDNEKEAALRKDPENKKKKPDWEEDANEAFDSTLRSAHRDEADALHTNKVKEIRDHKAGVSEDKIKDEKNRRVLDYRNMENVILGKLKKEYTVFDIKRDVRIRESNIVFDGAFWKDDHLYAIEIKFIRNFIHLQGYLERIALFVQGLPKKYRENFSLILCLVVESKSIALRERTAAIVDRYAFEVIIKHYFLSDF